MDLQDMSDPSNAQLHSLEINGPRSPGDSSEGSSRNTTTQHDVTQGLPRRPETTGAISQSNQIPESSRPIHHPTSPEGGGVDTNARLITSGSNTSVTPEAVTQAQGHNEINLQSVNGDELHLPSLETTISQVALPSVNQQQNLISAMDSSLHKPGSLRGPSYQDEGRNQPVGQPQASNGNGGGNKVLPSGFYSHPMKDGAIRGNTAAAKANQMATPPAGQKITGSAQRPRPTQSGTQAVVCNNDEGRQISVDNWNQPRNHSSGSLLLGDQNLKNQPHSNDGTGNPVAGGTQFRPEVRGRQGGNPADTRRFQTEPICNGVNHGAEDAMRQASNSLGSMAIAGPSNVNKNILNMAVADGNQSMFRKIDERGEFAFYLHPPCFLSVWRNDMSK